MSTIYDKDTCTIKNKHFDSTEKPKLGTFFHALSIIFWIISILLFVYVNYIIFVYGGEMIKEK